MTALDCDVLVVGGGINGAGIARDAAGRGIRTIIVDQGDFGGATSSASTKLIHGGLRYLEYYEFRLVAESLAERATMMRLAPHLVQPQQFVMPHVPQLRPAWMIRTGLWLYDRIGGATMLPGSTGVRLGGSDLGRGLKDDLSRGFSYFDAKVDDARLVLANIRSAQNHGATILPRRRLIEAHRENGRWVANLEHSLTGARSQVTARVLVNAGGPWVKSVLDASQGSVKAKVRLVKGSHIVVPRIHAGEHAYILQNTDRRVIFIIPYQQHWSLIGTTEVSIDSVAAETGITPAETNYLVTAVNRYLARPITTDDVVWSYSGVRPLYDDGKGDPTAITRDYTLVLDDRDGALQLAIFGGKLTTYRKLGEAVLKKISPWLDDRRGPWTADEALPGGNFPAESRDVVLGQLREEFRGLPASLVEDMFGRHGLGLREILSGATTIDDLGKDFGGNLFEREVGHFIDHEWAMTADDVLWRRSKVGLHMSPAQRQAFAQWFEAKVQAGVSP